MTHNVSLSFISLIKITYSGSTQRMTVQERINACLPEPDTRTTESNQNINSIEPNWRSSKSRGHARRSRGPAPDRFGNFLPVISFVVPVPACRLSLLLSYQL
ncbi:hypothetical protein [Mucilaginibacter psychrotolerans]|uniref:Uncharacterized protein n=1 Tax=Mucilaginibacter psychrotolerans TaxID=1524096 RepID=A0A4Y8SJ85_9SPHI|nr:hypothetical protein [Mucilaginibacter psychrotolerans]TFF38504.1 hypothetical protein E2R66_08535 [Mucilaginibacter psychrotolerans]